MIENSIRYLQDLDTEVDDLKEEIININREIECLKYKIDKKEQLVINIIKERN